MRANRWQKLWSKSFIRSAELLQLLNFCLWLLPLLSGISENDWGILD
jgi:hypothetical protein